MLAPCYFCLRVSLPDLITPQIVSSFLSYVALSLVLLLYVYLDICISILCSIEFNTKKVSFALRFYGPLCSSLTFWVLFSDSVDNDNNYNDDIVIVISVIIISMIIMLVTMVWIMITVLGSIVYHTLNLREKNYLS